MISTIQAALIISGVILAVCAAGIWIEHVKMAGEYRKIIFIIGIGGLCMCFCMVIVRICAVNIDKMRFGEVIQKGDTQLIVAVPKDTTLYLRGFVETQDTEAIKTKYEGLVNYLKAEDFYSSAQLSESVKCVPYDTKTVTVENVGATRRYLYLPADITKESLLKLDKQSESLARAFTHGIFGQRKYTFQYCCPRELDEYELTSSASDGRYAEMVYRNYVYDAFLTVSEDKKKQYKAEELSEIGGSTVQEAALSVRDYLRNKQNMTSREYTSEAVGLLRYCGIPARAVEGYYVRNENTDSKIELTCQNLHSWTELYLDGIGFVPFEVTPGFYEDIESEVTFSEINSENNKDGTEVKKQEETLSAFRKATRKILYYGIPILIFAMAVALIMKEIIYFRFCRKKMYSKNFIEFSGFLCKQIENVLKYDKIYFDSSRPYRCKNEIYTLYGSDLYEEYIKFNRYIDEVLYNQNALTDAQKDDMRNTVRRFCKKAADKRSFFYKYRMRYLG